jgi:Histone methylation protein DOT1
VCIYFADRLTTRTRTNNTPSLSCLRSQKIMHDHMKLNSDSVMVDLGHGIGNSCLQAAYSFGCASRGLECHKGRNDVSNVLSLKFQDAADIHATRDGMTFVPGSVTLRQGNLADPQHFNFLTGGVTHIFFDNWNGVFSGERLGAPNWERYVSALFASTPPGTVMTTVSPLRATLGPLPLSEANTVRTAKGLPASDDASYYELEEHILGGKSDVYSFSEGNKSKELINLYVYTRTGQSTRDFAVFLCNNPYCDRAKSGELIPAVTEEVGIGEGGVAGARIIGCCSCNVTDRVRRTKRPRMSVR